MLKLYLREYLTFSWKGNIHEMHVNAIISAYLAFFPKLFLVIYDRDSKLLELHVISNQLKCDLTQTIYICMQSSVTGTKR